MKPFCDDECLADARLRYETTEEPVAAIIADLGLSRSDFYDLARRLGWTLRRAPDLPRKDAPEPPPPDPQERLSEEEAEARATLVRRAWALAEAQVGQLERCMERLALDPVAQPNAVASRSIVSLVKALRELDALDPRRRGRHRKRSDDDTRFPRTLDEFRTELERHLEGLRRGRPGGAGAGEPVAGDAR